MMKLACALAAFFIGLFGVAIIVSSNDGIGGLFGAGVILQAIGIFLSVLK